MKFYSIAFIGILISACSKSDVTTAPPVNSTDSFLVTVNNGYGSGKYKKGDTVHIYSKEYNYSNVFNSWSGDIQILSNNDWHSSFVMPSRDLTFTASTKNATSFSLQQEMIRGRDRMKKVFSYFPANSKGTVHLFHGSGGTAQNLVDDHETGHMIRELVTDGFAVIITESEEATTGVDSDADGKLRWSSVPLDSITNVDYANIKILTDTFYNRGVVSRSKPRFSVGMSNGGAFSSTASYLFKFKAAISYCAQSGNLLASVSEIPLMFCMQDKDENDMVGQPGNIEALSNSQTLTSRGICSKYFKNYRSPFYPERLARSPDFSMVTSIAVYNELKAHGFIDSKNFMTASSSAITAAYQSSPASFPAISSLTLMQKLYLVDQVAACAAEHKMFSDLTKESLRFLNTQCL